MAEAAKRRRSEKLSRSTLVTTPTKNNASPDDRSSLSVVEPTPTKEEVSRNDKLSHSKSHSKPEESKVFSNDPSIPATTKDKQNWKGFCEIESEPALFNVMLKDFGVEGVKVQEVISLDEEILALLPTPVYGLIFLYKWHEESDDEQVESCPDNVWFANQTVKNACASIALLNIVNNVPGIELGPHLQSFKDFTADFDPKMRGEAIASFDFIKTIHNSFARKMDMLNADLQLKNDAISSKKRHRTTELFEEDEAAFHFIAYVPVQGKIWKLDGLQRQPQNLGNVEKENWIGQAKPEIEARMAQYEEGQIEFAILSLVKEPLTGHLSALAASVKTIVALETRLDEVKPDWRDFVTSATAGNIATNDVLTKPDPGYELCQATVDQAVCLPSVEAAFKSDEASDLIASRQQLAAEQVTIRMAIKEGQQSRRVDEERAESRRYDHGPLIKKLLGILKEKGALKSLLA